MGFFVEALFDDYTAHDYTLMITLL